MANEKEKPKKKPYRPKTRQQLKTSKEIVEKQVAAFLKEAQISEEALQNYEAALKKRIERNQVTPRDAQEHQDFLQWMRKYFEDNDIKEHWVKHRYFREFFKERGIEEPDVFIMSGQKTGGKTYSMSEEAARILNEPLTQIVWVRNTRMELEKGLRSQFAESQYPFKLNTSDLTLKRKPFRLQDRDYINGERVIKEYKTPKSGRVSRKEYTAETLHKLSEELNNEDILGYHPDNCGWAMYVNGGGMEQFQGGSYPFVKAMFWDEANDKGNLTDWDLTRFEVSLLSWTRKKQKMNLFITMNNLRHESGLVGSKVLEHFGVPYEAAWKRYETDSGLQVFFVDVGSFGDLFRGPADQAHFGLIGIEGASEDLLTNCPMPRSKKVLPKIAFLDGKPWKALLFKIKKAFLICYFGKVKTDEFGTVYVCMIDQFDLDRVIPGYLRLMKCDDMVICNQFQGVKHITGKKMGKIIKQIFTQQKRKKLYFSDDVTRELFSFEVSDKWKSRYSEALEKFLK